MRIGQPTNKSQQSVQVIRPPLQPLPTLRLVGMQVIGPLNPLPGMPKHGLRHLITAAKPGKPCSNRATQIMGGPSQTAVQPKLVGT